MVAQTIGTQALFVGGYTGTAKAVTTLDVFDAAANNGSGAWTTGNISSFRSEMLIATVGNRILFAGGKSANQNTTMVDIYNSTVTGSNAWTTANLSAARYNMASAVVGSKALFAGGSGLSSVVDIYDADANEKVGGWSVASLSEGRQYIQTLVVGTKAVFAGGTVVNQAPSQAIDIFESSDNTWTTASLSVNRSSFGAAVCGSKAFFAGGMLANGALSNVVDIYDAAVNNGAGAWTTAQLSQARSGVQAVTIGSKVLFVGGYLDPYHYSSVIDIYDSAANNGVGAWTTAALSAARMRPYPIVADQKVVFVGGDGSGTAIDIFDAAANGGTGGWTSTIMERHQYSTANVIGDKLIVTGGVVGNFYHFESILIFDRAQGTWSTTSFNHARGGFGAAALGNRLIIAGGQLGSSLNDSPYTADISFFEP